MSVIFRVGSLLEPMMPANEAPGHVEVGWKIASAKANINTFSTVGIGQPRYLPTNLLALSTTFSTVKP
jgi:hypothetical protein